MINFPEMIAAGLLSSAETALQVLLEKCAASNHHHSDEESSNHIAGAGDCQNCSTLFEMIGDINERKGEHTRAGKYYNNALQCFGSNYGSIVKENRIITHTAHNSTRNIFSPRYDRVRVIFKQCVAQLSSPIIVKGSVLQKLESVPFEERDAKINILMGKLYVSIPNYSLAIAAYKNVLQIFPEAIEIVDVLFRLGVDLTSLDLSHSSSHSSNNPSGIDSWVQLYAIAVFSRRNLDITNSLKIWTTLLSRHRENITFLTRTAETLLLPSNKPISLMALASQSQAVNILGSSGSIRASLGSFNVSSTELESARDILFKARNADPLSLEAMGLMARIHFQLGETAELRKLVDEAAAACDKRPESTLILAMLSILEGSPAKYTLSLISDAIRLDAEMSTSFKLQGYVHFLHNEYALAGAAYTRAAALDEEFSSYFGLVRAMIALGDFVEALEATKKAVLSLPHCYYAHLMLGIVRAHCLQGVVERVRSFGKALMLHPLSKTEAGKMAAELTCQSGSTVAVDSLVTAISMCAAHSTRVQLAKVFSAIDSDSTGLEGALRDVSDSIGEEELSGGDMDKSDDVVAKEDVSTAFRSISDERADIAVPIAPPESQEQWRSRLWPAKALNSFCRIITRCKPPAFTPGKKIHIRTGSDGLVAHWRDNELVKVGLSFESITAHNSAFFLLAVEESRECLRDDMSAEDNSEGDLEEDLSPRSAVSLSPWRDCEVTSIISESEYGGLPKICDPRLGSVWVVSVSYLPSPSSEEGGSQKLSTLNGGDLMLVYSAQWDHSLLGIVQPWDPDYYIKFGSINTSGYAAAGAKSTLGSFNLLLCIERNEEGQEALDTGIGGWAHQGTIMRGVKFSIARIGNVMTGIRECQALMSLKLLDRSLQRMIIDAPSSSAGSESTSLPSSLSSPTTDPFTCPTNVPNAMWSTFCRVYNESQLVAIKRVCLQYSNKDSAITLLQGPPGTGKTKTVLAIVSVFLCGTLFQTNFGKTKIIAGASLTTTASKSSTDYGETSSGRGERSDSIDGIWSRKPRVLLCAPSNTAVDELTYRLVTQGVVGSDGRKLDLNVVRIGHGAFFKDKGSTTSSRQSDEMRRIVQRVSLDYLVDEKMKQHKANESVAKQFLKYIDIRKKVLEKADVVCCTLSCAGSQPVLEVALRITGFQFDAVIIDEAGQAVEPSALIPFKYNPHAVVMVGDTCQLPAKVFSWASKAANYEQSLFQRLQLAGHPVTMLQTQYRMHPEIAEYPSRRFYQGKLVTDSELIRSRSHEKPYHYDRSARFRPFVFHDVGYGTESNDGSSYSNQSEAQYVLWLCKRLQEQYSSHATNIGVIAPYTGQRKLLTRNFAKIGGGTSSNSAIEVSTVDGFQGREKNIIIFSCTRAPSANKDRQRGSSSSSNSTSGSSKNEIGFLKVWQRLNVAITRAKYALWVVGHAQTLKQDPEWAALIGYAEEKRSIIHIQNSDNQGNDRYRPQMMQSHSSWATHSSSEVTIRPPIIPVPDQETRIVDGTVMVTGRNHTDRGERHQTKRVDEREQRESNISQIENCKINNINQKELSAQNRSSVCNDDDFSSGKPQAAVEVPEKDLSRSKKDIPATSTIVTTVGNKIKTEKDSSNAPRAVGESRYLEKKGNQGALFFQISSNGNTVNLCTGTKGCAGVNSSQIFDNEVKARQFVQCVVLQKCIAGFRECPWPCDMGGDINSNKAKRKGDDSSSSRRNKKIR